MNLLSSAAREAPCLSAELPGLVRTTFVMPNGQRIAPFLASAIPFRNAAVYRAFSQKAVSIQDCEETKM
jgi:hypothetical protein